MCDLPRRDLRLLLSLARQRIAQRIAEAQVRNGGAGRLDPAIEAILNRAEAVAEGREGRDGFACETATGHPADQDASYDSVDDLARRLVVSPQAIRQRCRRGTLPGIKVAGRWIIKRETEVSTRDGKTVR